MKKIVITGANGFIGSSLAIELMSRDYDVTCLVRKNSDVSLLPQKANILSIDYFDSKLMREIFSKNEVVIHTAALTKAKNWQQILKANVELTRNLVEQFNHSSSMKQFIFLSSQAASGPANSKVSPKKESDQNSPLTIYGRSKLAAEKIIMQKCKNWTIIRPVSIFGPGDKDFLQYFKLINKHISIKLGFKEKYFNLLYIDNLIEMVIRCIGNEKVFKEIIFAANEVTISQTEFSQMFRIALNKKIIRFTVPMFLLKFFASVSKLFLKSKIQVINKEKIKEFEQSYWLVSTQKAEKLLDYKAANNFIEQISKTYEWYSKKGWL